MESVLICLSQILQSLDFTQVITLEDYHLQMQ